MKLTALLAAGAVAVAGIAAVPAQAQYHGGYNDGYRYDHRDRDGDRRWDDRGRDDRRWDDRRDWRHEHRWRGNGRHYGWRDRPHVECRVVRGWYGPERRCFRVY